MPDRLLPVFVADHAEHLEDAERDEVGEVLAILHDLSKRVSSPILQVCLEDALADMVHLTACGERQHEGKQAAA